MLIHYTKSSRSFVPQLPEKECVAIAAFGALEASNQTLPVATIHLETTEGTEIPISVLITLRIPQPLRNLPFSYVKQLPYLKDLHLNHVISDSDDINISMLIGADGYWSIVQEAVIRGPGPTAVQSRLGYLLSGPLYNYTTSITFSVLHVQLHHNDRDFTRFLWPCCPSDPDSQLQTYCFRVVLSDSASSLFMLYAALHCYLTQCSSTVSKDLLQNLYVDKILSGRPTEEESVVFYSEARTILSEANFNLRSWASKSIQLCDLAKKDQVADDCEQVNTLGLVCNTASDKLSLAHKVFPLDHSLATKHEILQ